MKVSSVLDRRIFVVEIDFNLIDPDFLHSQDCSLPVSDDGFKVIVLDLRKVWFIGSAGLLWMTSVQRRVCSMGMDFCVVVSSLLHVNLLQTAPIAHEGNVFLDVSGALRSSS